jgi:hypothetical protein
MPNCNVCGLCLLVGELVEIRTPSGLILRCCDECSLMCPGEIQELTGVVKETEEER